MVCKFLLASLTVIVETPGLIPEIRISFGAIGVAEMTSGFSIINSGTLYSNFSRRLVPAISSTESTDSVTTKRPLPCCETARRGWAVVKATATVKAIIKLSRIFIRASSRMAEPN